MCVCVCARARTRAYACVCARAWLYVFACAWIDVSRGIIRQRAVKRVKISGCSDNESRADSEESLDLWVLRIIVS